MQRSESANDVAERAGSIVRDGLDVWVSQARRWHDRASDRTTWTPEDVVGDHTDLVEHLTPLAERSIDLAIDLLRPWARVFEARE